MSTRNERPIRHRAGGQSWREPMVEVALDSWRKVQKWLAEKAAADKAAADKAAADKAAAEAEAKAAAEKAAALQRELVSQLLSRGYTVQATVRSLASTTKLAHLTELPNAANNLHLFEADLLAEGAFDGCVAGADVIFHTASPFVTTNITDAQQQLYDPALKGTQNVFASIARSGSKPRVVLTSSVAAVLGKATDKATCFDEDDWNFSSKPEGNPPGDGLDLYRYSKLIAEREAWALAERQGLEMAAICPSFIMGPPRTRRLDGESVSNMAMALEGLLPHRPDTPLVDVRDCAAAHVAAAETAAAVGKRFITSSRRPMQRAEMLRWLAEAHPELAIHDAGSPQARDDCLGWIPTGARVMIASEGPCPHTSMREVLCPKNLPLLSIALREPKETVLDMAKAMLDLARSAASEPAHASSASPSPPLVYPERAPLAPSLSSQTALTRATLAQMRMMHRLSAPPTSTPSPVFGGGGGGAGRSLADPAAPSPPPPSMPPTQMVRALALLYESTGGNAWRNNDKWLSGEPCVDGWFGVHCCPQALPVLRGDDECTADGGGATGVLTTQGSAACHSGSVTGTALDLA
eukprot:jgi/Chrpa1/19666/Chrysochromulina_OHIO_Genome00022050-RA